MKLDDIHIFIGGFFEAGINPQKLGACYFYNPIAKKRWAIRRQLTKRFMAGKNESPKIFHGIYPM